MKTIFALVLLLIVTNLCQAQVDSTRLPPYKRFPENVPLQLLLPDSSTVFTRDDLDRKKSVLIMVFSPDCEHCQHETEGIIQHIDAFKDVQIVMATTLPYDRMKEFYTKYDLGRFKNIVVGSDRRFLLPPYYNIRNLPFLAFFDKKKKLIDVFEGGLPIEKVAEKFQ